MRDQRRRRGRHGLSPRRPRLTILAALVLWSGAATLSAAQTRARPEGDGRTLLALAERLGRVHYLRTLCRGVDDQTWRTRMSRLLELEAPAGPLAERLAARFNAGYAALQQTHAQCDGPARQAASVEARAAAALAESLATEPAPTAVEEEGPARPPS